MEVDKSEEQKKNRDELIPKVVAIQEAKRQAVKVRMVCGLLLIVGIFYAIAGQWVKDFSLIVGGGITILALWFAKKEHDYITHLKKTYGV